MTLKEAINDGLIEVDSILRITDSDKDIIVKVTNVQGYSFGSIDLRVFKGKCGNKKGERGFNNIERWKYNPVDTKKYPEYLL